MEHATVTRVKALAAEGLWQAEIARQIGISGERVRQIVAKHRIECGKAVLPKNTRKAELIERMKADCEGMTIEQAAAHLGASYQSIVVYKHESGFTGLTLKSTGPSKNERTQRIIAEAPALAERGLSKTVAAREMGIEPPIFTAIVRRYLPDLQWHDGRKDGNGGRRRKAG